MAVNINYVFLWRSFVLHGKKKKKTCLTKAVLFGWFPAAKSKAVESFHFRVIHIVPKWTSLDYSGLSPPNHLKLIAGTTWEGKSVSRGFNFPPVWPVDLYVSPKELWTCIQNCYTLAHLNSTRSSTQLIKHTVHTWRFRWSNFSLVKYTKN